MRKDKPSLTSGDHRVEMLDTAIKTYNINRKGENGEIIEKVKINTIEIDHGEMIPTYHLMKRLEDEHPDVEFYFVAGSDLFPSLHLWENGELLKKEINFLIFK